VLIHLSDGWSVAVSVVAWLVIGLVSGYVLHRADVSRFEHDNDLTRLRGWEEGGRWYQRRLRIRSWKDALPEKGDLFKGGFSKRHLRNRSDAHLHRFVAETRRAELVHWCNLAAGPLFLIWCRPAIGASMIVFGVVAHLPFVLIQRYNRGRLLGVIARRDRRRAIR
jgi:glycosyl-4,4'-diaponeurosporenoate acyltransferase